MSNSPHRALPPPRRCSDILAELAAEAHGVAITIDIVLDRFGQRSFGALLLVITLPSFIPLPIGGGLFGPLIALVGLQLTWGMERPWLPKRVRRIQFSHESLERALRRLSPVLRWVEKLSSPRWLLLTRRSGVVCSGISLLILGLALALPVPLTNFPLGMILLVFSIGLIEGDGRIIALSWTAALLMLIIMAGLGERLWTMFSWLTG